MILKITDEEDFRGLTIEQARKKMKKDKPKNVEIVSMEEIK